jgi:hypothetical protein
MLLLIIVLFLLFGGGGYWGYRGGYYGGRGFGLLGTVLIVLLVLALFSGPHMGWYHY